MSDATEACSHTTRPKRVDKFDYAAYKRRHGIGKVPQVEEDCWRSETRCSGCPEKRGMLCERWGGNARR